MRKQILATALVAALLSAGYGQSERPGISPHQPKPAESSPPPFYKGIYVLCNDTVGAWTPAQLANVTAFALRPDWSALQPAPGTFDWSHVTRPIRIAVDAGKKVTLLVHNGILSPEWIYQPPYNVPRFYFLRGRSEAGLAHGFAPAVMPVPWNETYLTLYTNLLAQLKKTIVGMGNSPKTGGPYWNEIFLVHMVGPTEGGAEMLLPTHDDGSIDTRGPNPVQGFPGHAAHNYAREWVTAGYTPQAAFNAFKRMMDFHATEFAGKYVALDTLPRYLFSNESIDTDGDGKPEFYPASVLDAVVVYGRARFGKLLTIQLNALNSKHTTRYDYDLLESNRTKYGVIVGFQTWQPPRRAPNNETLRETLQEGLRRGASYIEVYGPDVADSPAEIQFAHDYWQHH